MNTLRQGNAYLQQCGVRVFVKLKHHFTIVTVLDETDMNIVGANCELVDDSIHECEDTAPVLAIIFVDAPGGVNHKHKVQRVAGAWNRVSYGKKLLLFLYIRLNLINK